MNRIRLVVSPGDLLTDPGFSQWLETHSLHAVTVDEARDGIREEVQDIGLIRWQENGMIAKISGFYRALDLRPLPLMGWHDADWPPLWMDDGRYFGLCQHLHPGVEPGFLPGLAEEFARSRQEIASWDRNILQIVLAHLTRMTGEAAECLDFTKWSGFYPGGDLVAVCQILGGVDCTMTLHLLQNHARALASRMLGIPRSDVSREISSDTCREILNVIAGWIKAELAELGFPVDFNSPISIPGALRVDLGCGNGTAAARFQAGDTVLVVCWSMKGPQLPA